MKVKITETREYEVDAESGEEAERIYLDGDDININLRVTLTRIVSRHVVEPTPCEACAQELEERRVVGLDHGNVSPLDHCSTCGAAYPPNAYAAISRAEG